MGVRRRICSSLMGARHVRPIRKLEHLVGEMDWFGDA